MAAIRGIDDLDEWLTPSDKSINDKWLLDNLHDAALIIIEALEKQKHITVSYDIDSDGICSGTMMVRYLRNFSDKVNYIYHQREQGHGISCQQVPDDTELLIIVDSSTNETKRCKELSEKGVQVIVLDHHPKTEDNPYALIVNPLLSENYYNKQLSGSGVCYRIIEAIDELTSQEFCTEYQDLCGIGICADIMSLAILENRYFIFQALKNIQNPGVKAILKAKGINEKYIRSSDILFSISPIVNAVARLNHIELIVELLLEDNFDKCLELAKQSIKMNNERKKIESKLLKQFEGDIDNSNQIIILQTFDKDEDKKVSKGFNGLLAMKIAEKYNKPCLVIKNKEGLCEGSARSINKIPLHELLDQTGLCTYISGHSESFGLGILEKNIPKLIEFINNKLIKYKNKANSIVYDIEIPLDEIDENLVREIQKFSYISGKDFEEIKVLVKNISINERKIMGKDLNTIKLCADNINLLKFRTNELYAQDIKPGSLVDCVGTLSINVWYNFGKKETVKEIQIYIDDLRLSDSKSK